MLTNMDESPSLLKESILEWYFQEEKLEHDDALYNLGIWFDHSDGDWELTIFLRSHNNDSSVF